MSTGFNNFAGSVSNPTIDLYIQKPYPAATLLGTELGGVISQRVEVAGSLWIVTNATYSPGLNGFIQQNPSLSSTGLVINNTSGILQQAFAPAESPQPIVWQFAQLLTASSTSTASFIYNVRLPPYNAQGNGSTDDTVAIQKAANACAVTGGILYLPRGRYLISGTILLGNDTYMKGDGALVSTLVASNTFSGAPTKGGAGASVCLVANSLLNNASQVAVQFGIYVSDMGFNGNGGVVLKPSTNPGGCIFFRQVFGCGVDTCEIVNCSSSGIVITGVDNHLDWPGNLVNWRVRNNHINLNYSPGGPVSTTGVFPIVARGAGLGLVEGNICGELNVTHTNDCCDVPGCYNTVITNNYFANCGDGIGINAADNSVIDSNMIDGNNGFGISSFSSGGPPDDPIGCNHVSIVGNTIVDSGRNPGNKPGKTGIRWSCPKWQPGANNISSDGTIAGNTIQFNPVAAGPDGIHVEGSYVSVTGNTIDLGGTNNNGIVIDSSQSSQNGGPGNSNVTVTGNTIGNGQTGMSGSTGIGFNNNMGSVSTNCLVSGNTLDNTIGIPITPDYQIQANCYVRGNLGINPIGFVTPSGNLPLSGMGGTVTNDFPFDIQVYVNCGGGDTITQIWIDGTQTGLNAPNNGSCSVLLPGPQGAHTIALSGTGSPGWKWFAL